MGVHGLWELLAPVGRRVSVETIAGKRLAIDASIWMIQFMKAMRDERGEMVRNAHILGFFRRICKLLYLRTKPVFVFDGATPALKRRTVIARRRQRENAQTKIRKTAEKLLLNQVKAMRLKELAADLENQRRSNGFKGKAPVTDEPNMKMNMDRGNEEMGKSFNQEELDEMLAASLAAEENGGFNAEASTSGAGIPDDKGYGDEEEEEDDDDDDDDEEMILPEMHGKVDPAVLAALPPSMQLDLLVQMRERLMAENRQKYQKVKKAPGRFSELQIQAYLKTVAFRREIDGVQKSAMGRGIGGVQTSRIASEANREFIFSNSFTGDKNGLTSAGQERIGTDKSQLPPVSSSKKTAPEIISTQSSNAVTEPNNDEIGKELHNDVETYMDERGRLRVSRVRALGIRMTRDLQRNLDLMKEIEKDKESANEKTNRNSDDVLSSLSDRFQHHEKADQNSIEISFENTCEQEYGYGDDSLFAGLVAGNPVIDFSIGKETERTLLEGGMSDDSEVEWEEGGQNSQLDDSQKTATEVESECEWEEGGQNSQVKSLFISDESKKLATEGESECEWEEGGQTVRVKSPFYPDQTQKTAIEGDSEVEWEEGEENIQVKSPMCPDESQKIASKGALQEEAEFQEAIKRSREDMMMGTTFEDQETGKARKMDSEEFSKIEGATLSILQPHELSLPTNIVQTSSLQVNFVPDEVNPSIVNLNKKHMNCDDGKAGTSAGEILQESGDVMSKLVSSSVSDSPPVKLPDFDHADHSCKTEKSAEVSVNDSLTDLNATKELTEEEIYVEPMKTPFYMEVDEEREIEFQKDRLDEELLFLNKEREELGSEQRKLERNAESVNSEMFAECQELLQMFGLPYIIAPMEAEAQCAHMELLNLVDGVVTDDSDAFLFGSRSVYKNIFDDRKYVETYFMKDIKSELGLDRENIIRMALLLGSDYTEGISGIGIVNAIEIVNAFPGEHGFREFREWIESPDPTILGGNSKKVSKEATSCDKNETERRKQIFMDKHRNVSKNWHIPSSFPSDAVISAYTSPQVDKSTESFSWGKPDLFVLRKLCWEKFGWSNSKADELLLPVLKEYNKHETQLRLEAFYTFNERFAKIRSSRIKKAVKGITGSRSSDLLDEKISQKSRKKRKVNPGEEEAKESEMATNQIDPTEETNVKLPKRGQGMEKPSKSKRSNLEQSRSINRGRGRGKVTGRKKKKSCSGDSETSCDDSNLSERDGELQLDKSVELPSEREAELQLDKSVEHREVRRSGRLQKVVNYTIFDECDDYAEKNEGVTTNDSFTDSTVAFENEQFVDRSEQENTIGTSQSEYLQLGGGFCLEKKDKDMELDGIGSNSMKINSSDDNDDDLRNRSITSLRAMPNLRRKKRKA